MTTRERYKLILQPMARYEAMPHRPIDAITRLRWLLKAAKRHGLRCISCTIIPPKDGS